jgi:hypothetical protein
MEELPELPELPKKASTTTGTTSELNPPQLSTITPALPSTSIPRGPRAPPRQLEDVFPPPQDGWDADTGFPSGALIFQHPQAYPHMLGKDQSLLQQLNRPFQYLWIRLQRTPDKRTIVIWVEVAPQSGREAQLEKEGALNGLREFHKYDGGSKGELPWIGTFYYENHNLFHPEHRYYRVVADNYSTGAVDMEREVRSIYISFQSISNICFPGNYSTSDYQYYLEPEGSPLSP